MTIIQSAGLAILRSAGLSERLPEIDFMEKFSPMQSDPGLLDKLHWLYLACRGLIEGDVEEALYALWIYYERENAILNYVGCFLWHGKVSQERLASFGMRVSAVRAALT